MATQTSTVNVYTFARYVQGSLVDYVQCDAVSIHNAVAQLSEQWAGVFKYSSHYCISVICSRHVYDNPSRQWCNQYVRRRELYQRCF